MNLLIRCVYVFVFILLLPVTVFFSESSAQNKISKNQLTKYAEVQASTILQNSQLTSIEDYLGADGNVTAYSFTFKGQSGKLLNMLLSCDTERSPLIRYSYNEDPEKGSVDRALDLVKDKLNNPVYKGITYLGFGESWHRFDDGSNTVYVNLRGENNCANSKQFASHVEMFKSLTLAKKNNEAPNAAEISSEWERLQKGLLIDPKSEKYITGWSSTPDFDWHYGCTPTAASDVLGYYDVYYGYAQLLKYFYRDYDDIQTPHQNDETVPDIAKILKDKFGTNSSGTTIDASMGKHIYESAKQQDANYNWSDYGLQVLGVWTKSKEEVDGGYPSVLSVDLPGDAGGHSMPLLGYGTSPDRVFIYDVVNHPSAYFFNKSDLILWNLAWIHPPLSNTGRSLRLTSLQGACYDGIAGTTQTVYSKQSKNITWSSGNPGFGKISLYINTASGVGDWTKIVDLNNNPGSYGWIPDDSQIGTKNRLRIRWYDNSSNVIGEDASCTNFSIAKGTFPTYSTNDCGSITFPAMAGISPADNNWCVYAVKASSTTYTDYIDLFGDTLFTSRKVRDTVGHGSSRAWGMVGVYLGGASALTGPFGVKVTGSGDGQMQFVESQPLNWGESSGNISWDKDNDLVKIFELNIPESESKYLPASYLQLENNTGGDFVLALFNTTNRYFGYADYLKVADDSGNGGGEKLNMTSISSGRYLVLLWQKGSTLKGGNLSLSFKNYTMLNFPGFTLNRIDTIRYSGIVGPLPVSSSPWSVIGIIPDSNSVWEINASKDRNFKDSLIASFNLSQNISLLAMKRPLALTKSAAIDSLFIKIKRIKGAGIARLEINDYVQEAPFHDGDNPLRAWAPGRRFHIVPFQSAVSIKDLVVTTETANGPKVFCGIAPELPQAVFNAAMLWGTPNAVPEAAPDVKNGAVVLWTLSPPLQPFTYKIRTRPVTSVLSQPVIPHEFSISQNYPNPFNSSTRIDYMVPELSFVSLKVFNLLGNEICTLINEEKKPGYYSIDFNLANLNLSELPSSVYFYQFSAGKYSNVKKLIYLK